MKVSDTPERNADFSFEPLARMLTPSRVARNHAQKMRRTIRIHTDVESPKIIALPPDIHASGKLPPSIGRTSSAAPERIDHAASVTRNGWRRRIEISNPLTAPTQAPISRMGMVKAIVSPRL